MAGPEAQRVTPSGVRDGDPAALAALCAARGPAVLAYAQELCSPEDAVQAAAEAFARFRAAVIALGDLPGIDPDRLLLGAARRSTAALTPAPKPGRFSTRKGCEELPALLATRLEGELSADDHERVEGHLKRCTECRALAERFAAAERRYVDPPDGPVPSEIAAAIVGALSAAGPAPGSTSAAPPPAAAPPPPAPPPADDAVTALMPPVGQAPPKTPAKAPEPAQKTPAPKPAAPRPAAAPAFARAARHRPHLPHGGGLVRTVVLPLGVVGVAALLAMAIAGVFGERAGTPEPRGAIITAPAETIPGSGPAGRRPEPTTVRPGDGPPPGVPTAPGEDFAGGLGVPGVGVGDGG